jgi:hypothetical protein
VKERKVTKTEFTRLARREGKTNAVLFALALKVPLGVVQLWELTI